MPVVAMTTARMTATRVTTSGVTAARNAVMVYVQGVVVYV